MDIKLFKLEDCRIRMFDHPATDRERCGLLLANPNDINLLVVEVANAAASDDTFVIMKNDTEKILTLHPFMKHVGLFHTHPNAYNKCGPTQEDLDVLKPHPGMIGVVYCIPQQTLVYYTSKGAYKITYLKNQGSIHGIVA